MSAGGQRETLVFARRMQAHGVALEHSRALTPDAVAPGQQCQAQHGVAQLEDDAQGLEDVHQLCGCGVDPHGAGQKPKEGKYLPRREASWALDASLPWDPARLQPATSPLGTRGAGKEGLAGPQCALRAGGHLTQWYLGGSSLLVVMKMMMARTEPTSVTSPQTGKTPWIWYSPSAHGGEKEHQSGLGQDPTRFMVKGKSLPLKATSALSSHGAAPICPLRTWMLGAPNPHPYGENRAIPLQSRAPSSALHCPTLISPRLQRAPTVPRALVAIPAPSYPLLGV